MVKDVRAVSSKNFDTGDLKCKGRDLFVVGNSLQITEDPKCRRRALRADTGMMHARYLAGLKPGSG